MIDPSDYRNLLQAILKQAMNDYTKLQHPKLRRKKYLEEAFSNAVDMFFDSDYMLLHLQNGDGSFMSLEDFLKEALNTDRINIEKLKEHVVKESRAFWETKLLNTIYIPDNIIYDGHVYGIMHSTECEDPILDLDSKTITLNKNHENSENQEKFLVSLIKVALYHEDIAISHSKIEKIGKSIFKLLRMNACFIGD